jgi:hypothetical protein
VACSKPDGFIQKEELSPAPLRHHCTTTPLEFAGADQPCLRRPSPTQQRLRGRIVDDAPIASEHAPLRNGDDLAEGRNAVL